MCVGTLLHLIPLQFNGKGGEIIKGELNAQATQRRRKNKGGESFLMAKGDECISYQNEGAWSKG